MDKALGQPQTRQEWLQTRPSIQRLFDRWYPQGAAQVKPEVERLQRLIGRKTKDLGSQLDPCQRETCSYGGSWGGMSMKSLDLDEFAATRYEEKNGIQIVSVTGEVDLSSAPRLAEVIGRAKEQAGGDPSHVVVDLSEVEFMDTAGLEVLLVEWNSSRQLDGRMCLVAPEGPLTRLLEVSGLGELFDLYPELDAAVTSCASPSVNHAGWCGPTRLRPMPGSQCMRFCWSGL